MMVLLLNDRFTRIFDIKVFEEADNEIFTER